jgi:hypothetical protein
MVLTVTLFGDRDALDRAISDELERRGCRIHSVSIESGWLASTTNAVVRLDSAAGASALRGLTAASGPGVHVVATSVEPPTTPDSARLRHLCEECGANHEVSLIRHEQIAMRPVEIAATDLPVRHLAVAVVDEVTDQRAGAAEPSFSTRAI